MAAAKALLDKLVPNARSQKVVIDLPSIEKAADLIPAIAAIVKAMSVGDVTPEEAQQLAGVLELHRRTVETVELEKRMAEIEATHGKKQ